MIMQECRLDFIDFTIRSYCLANRIRSFNRLIVETGIKLYERQCEEWGKNGKKWKI